MGTERKKILLVDDYPLVRDCYRSIVELNGQHDICAEADSYDSAFAAMALQPIDFAVIDINLKQSSGLDLTSALRARYPDLRILVTSMHTDQNHAKRALDAGANGYLIKEEALKNLGAAIDAISSNRVFLSDRIYRPDEPAVVKKNAS